VTDTTAAHGVAEWLRLAATPTFAIMALLTALGGSQMDWLCSSGQAAPLNGMATMYLLMSAFHSPAWLNLIAAQPRQSEGRSASGTREPSGTETSLKLESQRREQ